MGSSRECDADGNVIPWPSDLKKRIRKRSRSSRPARADGTENAQRQERVAAFNTAEFVEQLKAEGLQNCTTCRVVLPVSAFPVAVPSSSKSVDGNGYLTCAHGRGARDDLHVHAAQSALHAGTHIPNGSYRPYTHRTVHRHPWRLAIIPF